MVFGDGGTASLNTGTRAKQGGQTGGRRQPPKRPGRVLARHRYEPDIVVLRHHHGPGQHVPADPDGAEVEVLMDLFQRFTATPQEWSGRVDSNHRPPGPEPSIHVISKTLVAVLASFAAGNGTEKIDALGLIG